MEEPFSILPMEKMCEGSIRTAVMEQVERSQKGIQAPFYGEGETVQYEYVYEEVTEDAASPPAQPVAAAPAPATNGAAPAMNGSYLDSLGGANGKTSSYSPFG